MRDGDGDKIMGTGVNGENLRKRGGRGKCSWGCGGDGNNLFHRVTVYSIINVFHFISAVFSDIAPLYDFLSRRRFWLKKGKGMVLDITPLNGAQ